MGLESIDSPRRNGNIDKTGSVKLGGPDIKYMSTREDIYKNLAKVPKMDGFQDVACHADEFGFQFRGPSSNEVYKDLTPREFAGYLMDSGDLTGESIRLFSCSSGKLEWGAAQQLSDEIGLDVLAPTMDVYIDSDGYVYLAEDDDLSFAAHLAVRQSGKKFSMDGWKLFKPRRK